MALVELQFRERLAVTIEAKAACDSESLVVVRHVERAQQRLRSAAVLTVTARAGETGAGVRASVEGRMRSSMTAQAHIVQRAHGLVTKSTHGAAAAAGCDVSRDGAMAGETTEVVSGSLLPIRGESRGVRVAAEGVELVEVTSVA